MMHGQKNIKLFNTDVPGQPVDPICKGQSVQEENREH